LYRAARKCYRKLIRFYISKGARLQEKRDMSSLLILTLWTRIRTVFFGCQITIFYTASDFIQRESGSAARKGIRHYFVEAFN